MADNNAVGVEAELLRIALANAQLPELQAAVSCGERINAFLHELINESAHLGSTQGTIDKTIEAVSLHGGFARTIQIPGLTRSRPK